MVGDHTDDPLTSERPRTAAPASVGVEVAFHPDLRRIGAVATFGAEAAPVDVVLGRDTRFTAAGASGPLADPCVSREQLRVRWSPADRSFRVEAAPGGRRAIETFDANGEPASGPLAPGSLVAIGDRVLFSLVVRPRDDGADLGLVGGSAAMIDVRGRLRALARVTDPVVVLGETGTGKELAAAALHAESPRARGPFLAVNCAALPANLAESELFGYERGAFSGALQARAGLFAQASGGTLFLDEIGELSLDTQAKLLRALQTGAVRPVGGGRERAVDVRVVAATHRDLAADVDAGRFRADLFARLDGLVVALPPLRARREDLPRLFATFFLRRAEEPRSPLARFVRDADRHAPPLPMSTVLALFRHPFPRNVRELEKHVAAVAAHTGEDGPLVVPALASRRAEPAVPVAEDAAPRPASDELARLLERHDYVQQRVAKALGVSHTTIDRWRRELGLPRPRDLDADAVKSALGAAKGDIDAAARSLAISARGLRLRMTELGLSA